MAAKKLLEPFNESLIEVVWDYPEFSALNKASLE